MLFNFGIRVVFGILVFVVTNSTCQETDDQIRLYPQEILSKQIEILELLKELAAKQDVIKDDECLGFDAGRRQVGFSHPAVSNIPCPDMLEDIAPGKSTFSSSVYSTAGTNLAIDGDDSSMFHSEDEKDPWWMIDLGTERIVYHIMILSRQDIYSVRFHDVEIRIGDSLKMDGDFSSYTLLYYYRGPYKAEEKTLMYTFPSGVRGRYLSLKIVKGESAILQINNFKVIALRN